MLVGGFNPSEKYESQLGLLFPNIWKNKSHVPKHQPGWYFQTTRLTKRKPRDAVEMLILL